MLKTVDTVLRNRAEVQRRGGVSAGVSAGRDIRAGATFRGKQNVKVVRGMPTSEAELRLRFADRAKFLRDNPPGTSRDDSIQDGIPKAPFKPKKQIVKTLKHPRRTGEFKAVRKALSKRSSVSARADDSSKVFKPTKGRLPKRSRDLVPTVSEVIVDGAPQKVLDSKAILSILDAPKRESIRSVRDIRAGANLRPKREPATKCAGGAKRANPWISHVKAYSKKHNIPYRDAMSRAKASYKPSR